jgi:hypothetical protein
LNCSQKNDNSKAEIEGRNPKRQPRLEVGIRVLRLKSAFLVAAQLKLNMRSGSVDL